MLAAIVLKDLATRSRISSKAQAVSPLNLVIVDFLFRGHFSESKPGNYLVRLGSFVSGFPIGSP
jgi:hypothetical protein